MPMPALVQGAGRARRFLFVPPNLDVFMTVHKTFGHEPDWLGQRSIFVPPNLLGSSNLSTTSEFHWRVALRLLAQRCKTDTVSDDSTTDCSDTCSTPLLWGREGEEGASVA